MRGKFGSRLRVILVAGLLVPAAASSATIRVGTPAVPDLAAAIAQVPALRATLRPGEAIEILLPPRALRIGETIRIDAAHGGTATSPLVIRGSPGGRSRLLGSVAATARAARAEDAPGRDLPPGAQALSLADLGVPTDLVRRGAYVPTPAAALAFFQGSAPLRVTRWPAQGWWQAVMQPGADAAAPLPAAVAQRLRGEPDLWAAGYWVADWAYKRVPVLSVARHESGLQLDAMRAPLPRLPSPRFAVENALAELRSPGQYVVDPARRLMLFLPLPGAGAAVEIARTATLMRLTDARNVELRDIAFDRAAGDALVIERGRDIRVRDCLVRQAAGNGIVVAGGARVRLSGVLVADTGERGVLLLGGDRASLTPGGHAFVDGVVTDFGRESPSYRPGIDLVGVGNRVAGSLVRGGDHTAILLSGNDLTVEGNEIADVLRDTEDAGAIYMGRDWTQRGIVIRGNYIHDLGSPRRPTTFLSAVYLDDQFSGAAVLGNITIGGDFGVVIGGGRDNRVAGNLFVDPRRSGVHFDRRGMEMTPSQRAGFVTKLAALPIHGPLWSARYPALGRQAPSAYGVPEGNVLWDNRVSGAPMLLARPAEAAGMIAGAGDRRVATRAEAGGAPTISSLMPAAHARALRALLARRVVPAR